MGSKCLLVFDFDHTVIDKNTDREIVKAQSLWGQCVAAKNFFTNSVGWAESMSYTLKDLHGSNFSKEKINQLILDIPLTNGMLNVFDVLRTNKVTHDIILLSHSNTYFLDLLLKKYECGHCFDEVFTYECEWTGTDGPLVVKAHDTLEVNCSICPPDFCKGVFLETHREKKEWEYGEPYDTVVYVGDGAADYCAALTLKETDFVLARTDYAMHRKILNDSCNSLKAKPVFWESGIEIVNFLNELFEEE